MRISQDFIHLTQNHPDKLPYTNYNDWNENHLLKIIDLAWFGDYLRLSPKWMMEILNHDQILHPQIVKKLMIENWKTKKIFQPSVVVSFSLNWASLEAHFGNQSYTWDAKNHGRYDYHMQLVFFAGLLSTIHIDTAPQAFEKGFHSPKTPVFSISWCFQLMGSKWQKTQQWRSIFHAVPKVFFPKKKQKNHTFALMKMAWKFFRESFLRVKAIFFLWETLQRFNFPPWFFYTHKTPLVISPIAKLGKNPIGKSPPVKSSPVKSTREVDFHRDEVAPKIGERREKWDHGMGEENHEVLLSSMGEEK